MFGTFRLVLAMGVALSHMGVLIWGIHAGIVGVVCFFMVSGYAMSGLIATTFPRVPADVPRFYLDRVLRLAPQYYLYLAVSMFTVFVLGWRESIGQSGSLDVVNLFANILVLPLTFWMFNASIGTLLLNIPTWSLGLELCFYLVLPWILVGRVPLYVAAFVGAGVWAIATHGLIDPDHYAYRLLPGTLVFFLVGVALQRRDRMLLAGIAVFFLACSASLWFQGKLRPGFNIHLLVGAAVGLVVMPILATLRRRTWDERLGTASYGCYLAHWIFVTALKDHYGEPWAVATTVLGSVACGWASYWLVEAPTVAYRRARRSGITRSLAPARAPRRDAA